MGFARLSIKSSCQPQELDVPPAGMLPSPGLEVVSSATGAGEEEAPGGVRSTEGASTICSPVVVAGAGWDAAGAGPAGALYDSSGSSSSR